MIKGVKGFRVVKRPQRRKFTLLWKSIPDWAWEAIGSILMKIVGTSIHGKILRLVVISIIAAATGAEIPEESQK